LPEVIIKSLAKLKIFSLFGRLLFKLILQLFQAESSNVCQAGPNEKLM